MRKHIFTFIFLLSFFSVSSEDSRLYRSWPLTSNLVESICQDAQGFIWVATEYGLNKFDGVKFVHYLHSETDSTSLLGNYVRTISLDNDQTLWVGCSNGLQYYLPAEDAFRTIHFENNRTPHVTRVLQLHNGQIWCVTSGRGVFSVDKHRQTATFLKEISNLCGSYMMTCIYEDKKHQIWIGTDKNGLIKINPQSKKATQYDIPLNNNSQITDILEDKDGQLYVCSTSSVEVYDDTNDRFLSLRYSGKEKLVFRDMMISRRGDILLGTEGQGLKCINTSTKTISNLENQNSIFDFDKAMIHSVFEDRDQNIWLGCFYSGVLLLSPDSKQFDFWGFGNNENKISGTVTAICKDYEGFVWCSFYNEGIFKFDNNGRVVKSFPAIKTVKTIFEDSRKTIWIGTNNNGLGVLNKSTGSVRYLPQFKGKNIKTLTEDRNRNLYISTYGAGFCRLNLKNNDIQKFEVDASGHAEHTLSNNWVNAMLLDQNGLLWIGHHKGMDCFDTQKGVFRKSKLNEIMSKNICFSLLKDRKGSIYFGTNNGLYIYDRANHSVRHFTTENGLSNNVISGLEEDADGNVWCSTFNGISQLKQSGRRIIKYYYGNEFLGKGYTSGAYFKDADGLIYFGGNNGIVSFRPQNITPRNYDRKVIITNFYLQGRPVNKTTLSSGTKVIDTSVTVARKFNLSFNDNTFTIELSTLDFADQENIYYEYRLNQLSGTWHTTMPGENRITYNYVPAGNYTFEVRACKDGSYSKVSSFDIYVAAPWYRSGLAYLFYFILVAVVALLIFRILHQVREEEINKSKFQYFINISHEIRSPMTLIISLLEKLLKETSDEKTKKALQMIHRNTNRVLGLINQLLDIRKFDKGQMKIKCAETDMVGFIKEVFDVFDFQAKARNIRFVFEHDAEYLPVWIDKNNFDKILINLLSNSFKYTADSGEIIVTLTTGIDERTSGSLRNYTEIRIMDSGIGIEKEKLEKIFDRFYQIENGLTFASSGSGIGLNLCRILVGLHHGTISAANRDDIQGSIFTVRIPSGKDHLQKDEIANEVFDSRPVLQDLKRAEYIDEKKKTGRPKTNYKVLVVDDDAEIRDFLIRQLEETYKVVACGNGNEAIQYIHAHVPDIIISDILMPEMDGFELLKNIRKNTNLSHIPVILLTSKIESEDRLEGLGKGADAYLSKPFMIDELFVLIENLITNRRLLKGKYSGNQDQDGKVKTIEFKSSDEILMSRVMTYINDNIGNVDMSVEMLAQSVGLSRVQLHRKLKEITGISTSEFIRNIRLKQAALLLKDKKMNIAQIAYAVGFINQKHFSTTFRKFYGISPREYIQKSDE